MAASSVEKIFFLIQAISYLLILTAPFLIAKKLKEKNFLKLLISSLIFTFILCLLSIYWAEYLSVEWMYNIYGFDPHGMSETDRWTKEISLDNRKTIEDLYNRSFGIGWPVKLILSYIIFIIPFNLIACAVIYW